MIFNQPDRVSPGKLAVGVVLALLLGTLAPIMLVLEMSLSMLMPTLM